MMMAAGEHKGQRDGGHEGEPAAEHGASSEEDILEFGTLNRVPDSHRCTTAMAGPVS
jgi:hypothetical protein